MSALYTQLCQALCDPMDCSLPGFSVHGIPQAKLLEWLPFPPPGDLPDPGTELMCLASPALAGGFFTTAPPVPSIPLQLSKLAQNMAVA